MWTENVEWVRVEVEFLISAVRWHVALPDIACGHVGVGEAALGQARVYGFFWGVNI